jgi:hypothetical protein
LINPETALLQFSGSMLDWYLPVQPRPKNNVFWTNYDASNPVESSGIVGKNFPFDLRIEARHRFEPGNRVELA